MIRFQRPPAPPGFAARVAQAEADVRAAIERGERPVFAEIWGDFKPYLSAAQRGRCGYCEVAVTAGFPGDVEHFAPKSDLRAFDGTPGEEGVEQPNSYKVKGRRPRMMSDTGYWWLAYRWDNYLLSCSACNSAWKGNLFPVKEPPARVVPPDPGNEPEVVLLLNPFGRRDPAVHLRFNADGSVEPRANSQVGRETIRTVGLHRTGLVEFRRWTLSKAREAAGLAASAAAAGVAPAGNIGLRDLHGMGEPDAWLPGAVRSVIRQELDLTWEDLDVIFGSDPESQPS